MADRPKEKCWHCESETGRAGRDEDSLFMTFPERDDVAEFEIGPLCEWCFGLYQRCNECFEAVHPEDGSIGDTHKECGGEIL